MMTVMKKLMIKRVKIRKRKMSVRGEIENKDLKDENENEAKILKE